MNDSGAGQTLRVGFDDQIFQAQLRGGISKYFVELVERLPQFGIEPVVLSTSTRNLHLAESGLVPRAPEPGRLAARTAWASWRLFGRPRTTPRPMPQLDVMHHTFTHGSYLRSWSGPSVVTMFDMTPELFPSYFKLGNPHFAKRRYCDECDAIISISQNTADDMYRLYGDAMRDRTTVIPFGVGEEFLEPGPAPAGLPERYVLFVGVRTGYKDFPTAVEAYARVAADDPDLALVVVGGGAFTSEELDALAAAGVADRVTKLQPSDAEMPETYRRAAVFLFPSLYEGFGLPTLESLAAGTPTILADASCSREVGGDAALYFEPANRDQLVDRIREALSPSASEDAQLRGPARAREFGWDRVAQMTADLYRSLAPPHATHQGD